MITALEQEGSEAGWAGAWPKLRISEKVQAEQEVHVLAVEKDVYGVNKTLMLEARFWVVLV